MRKPNAELAQFLSLFKVAADCRFWCFEVKCYFLSSFAQIAFHQFSWNIFIEVEWVAWSWFTCQWDSATRKIWKPVLDLVVSNDNLAINTTHFLSCLGGIFVFLNSHNISSWICTFSFKAEKYALFILRPKNQRLNYDQKSFTSRIGMTNEAAL